MKTPYSYYSENTSVNILLCELLKFRKPTYLPPSLIFKIIV